MKKIIKTIKTIVIMGIVLLFGAAYTEITVYAQTMNDVQVRTEANKIEMIAEVQLDGYGDIQSEQFYNNFVDMCSVIGFAGTNEGLQLYFNDGTGYYIDVDSIYDNPDNMADDRIGSMITDAVIINEHIIDMRTVTGFDVSVDGLQLYLSDGTGYWLKINK